MVRLSNNDITEAKQPTNLGRNDMKTIHGTFGYTSTYKVASRLNEKGNLQLCIKRAFLTTNGEVLWQDVYHSGNKTWASAATIQKELLEIKRVETKYSNEFELI